MGSVKHFYQKVNKTWWLNKIIQSHITSKWQGWKLNLDLWDTRYYILTHYNKWLQITSKSFGATSNLSNSQALVSFPVTTLLFLQIDLLWQNRQVSIIMLGVFFNLSWCFWIFNFFTPCMGQLMCSDSVLKY